MTTLADKAILSGDDNRPPMLEKRMYDSWKSRMELYMMNRQHERMILEFVENGPLIWPTIEENGVTRPKKYSELSATEAIQADCDVKATNIIFQGLPPEVYALVGLGSRGTWGVRVRLGNACVWLRSIIISVKPRADTNKSIPLIPPNTEPPKGRPVPTSKIVRAEERVNLVFGSMPIVDHVVSFPMESEGAVDGRGITRLFGSMVRKLSSLERIDRQATLHAVTIEEIRIEISESSPLRPYISRLSLAKKVGISHETSVACSPQQNIVVERCNHTLIEGKIQPKADIGIFIGYAPIKKAFWIYNRRTRRIVETIHVDFDELTAMASDKAVQDPHFMK
nr:retrovirus-related Pol polyprotein from transposon TNT 1-94 [Tanacetum cinerariifolium]